MRKTLVLDEEEGGTWAKVMDKVNPILGFKVKFLGTNENQMINKVDVRNINFQDLMRHLQRGESVLITPKLLSNSSPNTKKQGDVHHLYVTHV
jgi:hypothetical protein